MESGLVLYGMEFSPMVRACKHVLELLDLKYKFQVVDLFAKEQSTPEFAKKNPLKVVPVLEDNGEYIGESAAICCYLVDKYGKNDALYPKDLMKRAKVNQSLLFMVGQVFPGVANISISIFKKMTTVVNKEKISNLRNVFGKMEALLEGRDFMPGNNWTIADLLTAPIVMIGRDLVKVDAENFPRINTWMHRIIKEVPHFDAIHTPINKVYLEKLRSLITEIEN